MNSNVYAQSKGTPFKQVWLKVRADHAKSTFTFEKYNFKIDDVVYESATPEWKARIAKLMVWEKLGK